MKTIQTIRYLFFHANAQADQFNGMYKDSMLHVAQRALLKWTVFIHTFQYTVQCTHVSYLLIFFFYFIADFLTFFYRNSVFVKAYFDENPQYIHRICIFHLNYEFNFLFLSSITILTTISMKNDFYRYITIFYHCKILIFRWLTFCAHNFM